MKDMKGPWSDPLRRNMNLGWNGPTFMYIELDRWKEETEVLTWLRVVSRWGYG